MSESFDWAQGEKNFLIRRSGPLSCVRIVGQRIGVALYGVWSYAGFSISDFHPILSELWGCLGIRLSVEVEGSKPWVMIEAT